MDEKKRTSGDDDTDREEKTSKSRMRKEEKTQYLRSENKMEEIIWKKS